MKNIKEYDVFVLSKDLNSEITSGTRGVILMIYDETTFEVEFVKPDGTNKEYNGRATFTIDASYIGDVSSP